MRAEITALDFSAGDTAKPEFLALNPNAMVPVLVDGDVTLWESNAINIYLVEKAGGSSLFPADPQIRADIVRWQFWELAHFNRAFGTLVFEGVIKPKFGMGAPSDGLVAFCLQELDRYAPVLDRRLEGRDTLVGDGVTLGRLRDDLPGEIPERHRLRLVRLSPTSTAISMPCAPLMPGHGPIWTSKRCGRWRLSQTPSRSGSRGRCATAARTSAIKESSAGRCRPAPAPSRAASAPSASMAADEALHVGSRLALDQQAEAVAAADQRQRRLGRAEHGDVGGLRRGAAQRARMALRLGPRRGADDDAGEPAEGRQRGALALGDLALVEGFGVARDDRLHHRMVGLVGLQQAAALLAGAPGAARHLAEQLEGALGGARVAIGEAEIGIDDADQRHVREIVALGDELRADDDVGLALGDRLELQPQPLHAAQHVGRQHDGARLGKVLDHLLGDALDARAAGDEMVERAAFRAGVRRAARDGRNGGRRAGRESGARPARPSSPGTGSGGRRRGRASAAHSRGG